MLALSALAVPATVAPSDAPPSTLWESTHLAGGSRSVQRSVGAERAPDPHAVYTYVRQKRGGTNPGVVVQDPRT